MSSINIWDDQAGLESCWFECETNPTSAYSYPSKDQDFLYLSGYRLYEGRYRETEVRHTVHC